jgi:hypothetical protein
MLNSRVLKIKNISISKNPVIRQYKKYATLIVKSIQIFHAISFFTFQKEVLKSFGMRNGIIRRLIVSIIITKKPPPRKR